jgi:hypothetical protein
MEISPEIMRGLQLSGDPAHIPDALFKKLVSHACSALLEPDQTAPLQGKLAAIPHHSGGRFVPYYRPYQLANYRQ